MTNQKFQSIISGDPKKTAIDLLKNPQKIKTILTRGKGTIDKITDFTDISKWFQKTKNEQRKKDQAILKIVYLLLSSETKLTSEQINTFEQIASQFGNSGRVKYSEFAETAEKLRKIRKNNSFDEFCNVFCEEVKDDCNVIQRVLGVTFPVRSRRAFVIWIASAISIDPASYPEQRKVLEKLTGLFKLSKADQAVITACGKKQSDSYLFHLLYATQLSARIGKSIWSTIEYDPEMAESYIHLDFIQAVENDCKLIIQLDSLIRTEKRDELKKKMQDSVEQITAYLLDRISPHDSDREFDLDDEE